MMGPAGFPDHVRAIFLSDLHLGYRLSNVSSCIELLSCLRADQIYLIGDIVDVSRMSRQWYWPAMHQQAIDAIKRAHDDGTQVFVMPGNHDSCFRSDDCFSSLSANKLLRFRRIIEPLQMMNVSESFAYQTLAGKKLLITHGDLFDNVDRSLYGIPRMGSRIFDRISWLFPNGMTLALRRVFKLLLSRPQQVEAAVVTYARQMGYDGAVFGHLHTPLLKTVDGQVVANTGDWLENQSCMIETLDGCLILMNRDRMVARIEPV